LLIGWLLSNGSALFGRLLMITATAIASFVSAVVAVLLVLHLRQSRKALAKLIADLKRQIQERDRKREESAKVRWKRMDARLLRLESCLRELSENRAGGPPAMSIDASLHVVISLPKCGSGTMVSTLARAFFPSKVYHVHNLSKRGADLLGERWLTKGSKTENRKEGLWNLQVARDARMAVEERRARHGSPVGYYLCGVRDPVALAVSAFFQRYKPEGGPLDWDELRESIGEEMVLAESGIFTGGVSQWFDREIRDMLGIDVFSTPFDFSRGYQIYENEGARLLVIRQENLDGLRPALGELYRCQEETFEISSANRAADKPISETYREALERLRFDESMLGKAYGSRYARHFYSEHELEAFRSRWAE
jgi:hypothetical protein